MSDKLEILKMIENGEITVEQGLEMIEAVEMTEKSEEHQRAEVYRKQNNELDKMPKTTEKEMEQIEGEIYPTKGEKMLNFDVSLVSCKINIEKSMVDDVTVELMDSKTREFINQPDWLEITEKGDTITIKENRMTDITSIFNIFKNGFSGTTPIMINVKLPKSASIDRASFKNVSGSTSLIGLKAIDIEVKSISGNVHIADVVAKNFQVKETSGSIIADNVRTANGVLKSTSGKIKFMGNAIRLEGKNVSGSIEIECGDSNENLNLSTVSGKITVNVSQPETYNLNLTTVSGSIETNGFAIVDKSQPAKRKVFVDNRSEYRQIQGSSVSGGIILDKIER